MSQQRLATKPAPERMPARSSADAVRRSGGAGLVWLIGALSAWPGCAARSGQSAAECSRLTQRVAELDRRLNARDERVEELNQRIFLLEDRIDTTRVALERRSGDATGDLTPRLPVVRIGAVGGAEATVAASEDARDEPLEEAPEAVVRPDGPRGVQLRDTRRILDEAPRSADSLPDGAASEGGGQGSLVASEAVAYGGAALRGGPRPLLRLRGGSPTEGGGAARETDETLNLAGVDEALPVVPVVTRAAARAVVAEASEGEAMRLYQRGLASYRTGQPALAAPAFREFVRRYGQHPYADNALYWLGECLYDQKQFGAAQEAFRRVIDQYPGGNKAPDAMLKLAFAYLASGDPARARIELARVRQTYPQSEVAQLAERRLSALR